MADPGLPRGPTPKKGGHQPIILPNFPEDCMKMKNIGRGASKICLRRSVTGTFSGNVLFSFPMGTHTIG